MIVFLIMMMLIYLKVNKNNNHKEYLMKIELQIIDYLNMKKLELFQQEQLKYHKEQKYFLNIKDNLQHMN